MKRKRRIINWNVIKGYFRVMAEKEDEKEIIDKRIREMIKQPSLIFSIYPIKCFNHDKQMFRVPPCLKLHHSCF